MRPIKPTFYSKIVIFNSNLKNLSFYCLVEKAHIIDNQDIQTIYYGKYPQFNKPNSITQFDKQNN